MSLKLSLLLFCMVSAIIRPSQAFADDVSLTWESCVNLDTLVTKSGVCYVKNLAQKGGYWEVTVAFGININVGNVVVGGGGSSMLVAKAKISGASDEKAAIRKLEAHLATLKLSDEAKEEIIEKVKAVIKRGPASALTDVRKVSSAFSVQAVAEGDGLAKYLK